MSRVKDLEIRGIRNFGDEQHKALIHFSKPLTLILGPNGTGKTTIIEALKFITSGEYPPDSDKGKSFVHEPRMSHTVRGQVKAKIIDKKGKELVITRTMQVSRQKHGALKFTTLDNTITRIDDKTNEKVQISSRCADIDREMLIAMGVSKPILNYVIFCHQEESNWPLEDGKKLKERFDEIFDTSKYNKALDATTKIIKEFQSDLNQIKAVEESLKMIVDEVENQENKLKDDENREQEGKKRINAIDEAIIPLDERIEEIHQAKKKHDEIEEKIQEVETDYKLTNNYIESLKKHIKHMHTGSKEILVEKLETYDQNLTQKVTTKKKHENELEEIEKEEKILSKKLADSRIQLGSLTQKKLAFDEKVSRRDELMIETLKTWEIPYTDSKLSEEEIQDYINEIKKKAEDFAMTMKKQIQENEREEKYVQEEVDTCRTEKTGIDSEISLKGKEKAEIKAKINDLRKKITETGRASDRLSSVESNLQNASNKYDSLVNNFKEDSLKENLMKEITKKKELDLKLHEIDQEINSLHQQSSQQAELELHQNRLEEKEKNILSLKSKHKNNLELLLEGNEIPQKKIKDTLDKVQKTLNNEKNNLCDQIEDEQKKITTLETNLKYKEKELLKIIEELEGYKDKVKIECQGNDYDEMLIFQEKKVKSLQDKRGIYANQSLMYEEYLKNLKKKSCCPLCDRRFQDSSEEKQLEQKLYSEIKKSPKNLQDCEKELKIEQARYDSLQQLKPLIEKIMELENKIPEMKVFVEETKADLEKSEQNLENLRLVLSEPEEKISIYRSIIGDIILLDSFIDEKDNLSHMIETKKYEMQKAGKIGDRSMQEAQNARQITKTEIATTESNIATLQKTLQDNQEKIQNAREYKNKLNEEVIQIRQSMQELKQIEDKLDDYYKKSTSLENDLKSLRAKLVDAEAELSAKVEELDNLKKKNREEQESKMNFKSRSSTALHGLETIQQEVSKYISSKIEENLQKTEADVEKIKEECERKKSEKLSLEEKIRFLDEQCRSQETGKKDLENNLDLIEKKEHMNKINEKLSELRKQLKNIEFDKLKKEFQKLTEKKDEYEKEKNEIRGAQGELENSIKALKRNLNQEKFRMARHNYKKKQLEYVIQSEAISNLKTYATILDKAMIQFHEERMNTVNKIMQKLWSLVYGGNDTTSIQIRVQTTEGIGDKRRSYNYKLVQVKRSTEMDMKGRCSAGQKVLASIIIRLALAETFCSDCAVLALDEPTTNLDDANATNLAVTLSKVIQLRAQHHKNFQLIVISHDEKFISYLSNLSGKQVFQELYRNMDGYSLVRRRDMTDYNKDGSQSVTNDKYEDDSDQEDDDEREESYSQNRRKRNLCLEDSPPRSVKRRAYY